MKYIHIANPNIFPTTNSPPTIIPYPQPSPQPTPSSSSNTSDLVEHDPLTEPFTDELPATSEGAFQQNCSISPKHENSAALNDQSEISRTDENSTSTDDSNTIKPEPCSLSIFSIFIGGLLYASLFGLLAASLYYMKPKH